MTHKDEHVKSTSKIYEVHTNVCTECKQKIVNNNSLQETIAVKEGVSQANKKIIRRNQNIEHTDVMKPISLIEHRTVDSRGIASSYHSHNVAGDEGCFPLCKSENDLRNIEKPLKSLKERSKFTASTCARCNTFVGSTSECLKTVDFETRLKNRNISVPNHIPVKMYVKNIESSRNKTI